MDNPLFLIPIIVGAILVISGLLIKRFPPKKMNLFYGYRTPGSLKNQDRWDFAQKQAALESIRLGTILTLSSIIGIFYRPSEVISVTIGLFIMILVMAAMIIRVESAIKRKFGSK